MSNNFPIAPLGDAVSYSSNFVTIDDFQVYKRCRVQLHAQGIVERDVVSGVDIKTKKQQVCRANEFLVAEIDAKLGGFGIVPEALDGAIVSSHYFLFTVNEEVLNRRFLEFFIRTPTFLEQVRAKGSTNYAAIRPSDVIKYEIPLPPLEEQRRIVVRIEELAAKIEEARGLRREAVEEAKSIFTSVMKSIWRDQESWNTSSIGELVTIVSGLVDPRVEPYANLPHINGEVMEAGTGRLLNYRLAKDEGLVSGKFHFKADAILYSKIRPYLRKAVQVPVEGICSADVYAFDYISPKLEPRFFLYTLIAPTFTDYANDLSGRTRMPKLNQEQLLAFQMRYPFIREQQRIVAYLDELQARVDALKCIQAETSAELDALLPSVLDKAFKGEL